MMRKELKIVLFPEEHKSKNGFFFEELVRNILETQRYEITKNVNYTGLEIDLIAKHKDRNELTYVECKAKEKPKSTELKNFAFNIISQEVNYGYFIHTVELDHQAAGLKDKLENDPGKKYGNITFMGPDKIIKLLIDAGRIKKLDLASIKEQGEIHKLILAYTYFGIFYIVMPYEGTKKKKYYLFDAKTGKQIRDTAVIADYEHSQKTSIHNALKAGIGDLEKVVHDVFERDALSKSVSDMSNSLESEKKEISKPKLVFLYPDPIDKSFGYDFRKLTQVLKRYAVEIDCMYLSEKSLERLEDYNYAFIFTQIYKNKIYIEDENLKSKLLTIEDFEMTLFIDNWITNGIFIFTQEKIDFNGIDSDKPVVNVALKPGYLKKDLAQLFHHLFSRQEYKEKFDFSFLNKKKIKLIEFNKTNEKYKPPQPKMKLPDLIDPKSLQNFVGRKLDRENIIKKILTLEFSAKILNIKGPGGIGKTTIAKKVTVDLAKRNYFKDGIHFVACEHILDADSFEAKIAQCFDMDNVINLKEHLRNYERFDSLVILDNFESLLTLDNGEAVNQVKNLVCFVCDYSTILVTSRQAIGYDFEDVYELNAFTTDEAIDLFYSNYDKLSKYDEKVLRTDILENLLNNNPLAIKIITKNLPKHKNIRSLKDELEENFFANTCENFEDIFDKEADVNIEKSRSLYHSINYSYQKLDDSEKLALELLYLFPDGIYLEDFKKHFSENSKAKSTTRISDRQIKTLENKSLVENSNGHIRLQSIIGRFAEYQFKLRTKEEQAMYYEVAFSYNYFFLKIIKLLMRNASSLAYYLFANMSTNILVSLDYLDKLNEDTDMILIYIDSAVSSMFDTHKAKKTIEKLQELEKHMDLDEKGILFFKTVAILRIYYSIEFSLSFKLLKDILPLEKLFGLNPELLIDSLIFSNAHLIYDMEGFTYQILKDTIEKNIRYSGSIHDSLFRLGIYEPLRKFCDYDRDSKDDYFHYEVEINTNQYKLSELKKHIDFLYPKDHLGRMQYHYTLAKVAVVKKEIIKKLVVTNPYTEGLKNLMYAFIEEENEKKHSYFRIGIKKLKHIKYYYIEGIYFYARYLKNLNHEDYQRWIDEGYGLAEKYHYRFLKHQFINLKNDTNHPYNENKYPLPDNLDIEGYIEKYNKYWSDENKEESIEYIEYNEDNGDAQ